MNGEAAFVFKCGTEEQANQIQDWLECEDWPEKLREQLEEECDDLENLAAIVFSADPEGNSVVKEATGPSSLDTLVTVLDYAMQTWGDAPSPQGFTFGRTKYPADDPITYENVDLAEFDGDAVILRRGREPDILSGSIWLDAVLGARDGE